jgi:aldehyde oxidoreductase
MTVTMKVNGKKVETDLTNKTLLRFLREDLGLVGTKDGCSQAQCGTCTIILDGKAVKSCTKRVGKLDGAEITTIEGLAHDGELDPVQTAFLINHGYQCGFCTPGVILSVRALLNENPHPSDEEIKEHLKGNICRCTGYQQIIESVHTAIDIIDGKIPNEVHNGKGWVGDSPTTKHGVERVTGAPIFVDDFAMENALEGRIRFADYPHANIKNIDCTEAEKMPGVEKIITSKDIPAKKTFVEDIYPQDILAINKVHFIGEPVAVVFADTVEHADAAAKAINIDYEVLEVITSAEQGLDPNSERVHPETPNAYHVAKAKKGNVERGFAESDVIVEQEFVTQRVEHGILELNTSLAKYDDKGRMVLYGTGQNPTKIKSDVCKAMGLKDEELRYVNRPAGGAFGGLEDLTLQIFAALGTYHTKKPVRVTITRRQVQAMTPKRHPIKFKYKTGVKKDGTLMAIQGRALIDSGAYNSLGDFLATCTAAMGSGPYDVPNTDFESTIVFTNNTYGGCFRGYGSTQVTVCNETLLDKVAEAIGMDPFEFRMKNGLEIGKQTPSGQIIDYSCGFKDCLKAIHEAFEKEGLPEPSGPNKKVGYGIAGAFKNSGYGNGMEDGAGVKIELTEDGKFLMHTGAVECGQGVDTVVCQIAAQTLGIDYDDINIGPVDDDVSPYSTGSTSASRATYGFGNSAKAVSIMLKEMILNYVAEKKDRNSSLLEMNEEGVYDLKDDSFKISYADIAKLAKENGDKLVKEYYYVDKIVLPLEEDGNNITNDPDRKVYTTYIYSAQIAVVEVDTETGKVRLLKMYAASDVGKSINPALVDGQLIGSVVMGMGYALGENFEQKDGLIVRKNLKDLNMPTILDAPTVETFRIEETHPFGPYHAKGLGEGALNPAAPAILNAIYNAVGVRVNSLPVDKDKLAEAIKTDKVYK